MTSAVLADRYPADLVQTKGAKAHFAPYSLVFFDPPYKMAPDLKPGTRLNFTLQRLGRDSVTTSDVIMVVRVRIAPRSSSRLAGRLTGRCRPRTWTYIFVAKQLRLLKSSERQKTWASKLVFPFLPPLSPGRGVGGEGCSSAAHNPAQCVAFRSAQERSCAERKATYCVTATYPTTPEF